MLLNNGEGRASSHAREFLMVSLVSTYEAESEFLVPNDSAEQVHVLLQGAYLVNTARGAIVDRDSLVKVMNDGHLAGEACSFFS